MVNFAPHKGFSMNKGVFAALCLLAAAAFLPVSCEKYIIPRLDCDTDTIFATVDGGLYDVHLNANVRWAFDDTSIADWVSVDVKSGASDYETVDYLLQVRVKANDTGAGRECTMNYTSTTLSRTLVVQQQGE